MNYETRKRLLMKQYRIQYIIFKISYFINSIIIKLRNRFFPNIIANENRKVEKLLGCKVVTTDDELYGIRPEDCIPKDK